MEIKTHFEAYYNWNSKYGSNKQAYSLRISKIFQIDWKLIQNEIEIVTLPNGPPATNSTAFFSLNSYFCI